VLGGVGKRAQQATIVLMASYGISLPLAFFLCLRCVKHRRKTQSTL
jgi:hypothetical protein